jgi:hypothetical protein
MRFLSILLMSFGLLKGNAQDRPVSKMYLWAISRDIQPALKPTNFLKLMSRSGYKDGVAFVETNMDSLGVTNLVGQTTYLRLDSKKAVYFVYDFRFSAWRESDENSFWNTIPRHRMSYHHYLISEKSGVKKLK